MEEENWKLITLKIPPKMLNQWNYYAKSQGLKRSELIRDSVNDKIRLDQDNNEIMMETFDKIVKLYVNGLEKRFLLRFQRLETLIQALFELKQE